MTEEGTIDLSGTFFWVMATTQSLPLTAKEVNPAFFTALKEYSIWYNFPYFEKTVISLSADDTLFVAWLIFYIIKYFLNYIIYLYSEL